MNYLAIDTSSKYLTVIACKQGAETIVFAPDCALQHSVCLMDAIENALEKACLSLSECNFFCAVTGPGSFTGIRIGVSAVKGFCTGTSALAMGVTSFEVLAYNTTKACLAVIDAGRNHFYVCGFDENKRIDVEPVYLSLEETVALIGAREVVSADQLPFAHTQADAAVGLSRAVKAKSKEKNMGEISAFYLKKSQAEEEKK